MDLSRFIPTSTIAMVTIAVLIVSMLFHFANTEWSHVIGQGLTLAAVMLLAVIVRRERRP